jgi:RNA polymerase sigma factor (TIGR02999 family)
MCVVYDELRRLAGRYLLQQSPGHTLQPTALVHEAYLRLMDRAQPDWRDRVHFFSVAATIMRQVLVDHARTKLAEKRGGRSLRVEFRDVLDYCDEKAREFIVLDDALRALEHFDARKARILQLRYFAGMTVEEVAEALGLSIATVGRETRYAEAWLRRELGKEQQAGS